MKHFLSLLLLTCAFSGCITTTRNYYYYGEKAKQPAQQVQVATVTQTQSAPKNNGFSYCKSFSADEEKWYKIAELAIKDPQMLGKQSCAFKIYSSEVPHTGTYYASFYFNLRLDGDGSRYFGHFYCTDWHRDEISDFSISDMCLTYDFDQSGNFTTTIWKKAQYEDVWITGIEFAIQVGQDKSVTFAENNYYGNKDAVASKPVAKRGARFVIDAEDVSKK